MSEGRDLERRLAEAQAAGELPGLHSVVVLRGGKLFAEAYFPGDDQRSGEALGVVAPGPETAHDLRSVSKSMVGLLYGIALDEGLVPRPEAPLMAQFPEHADLAGPDKAGIAVGHPLTMTLGIEWNEDMPYDGPHNSEVAMEMAPDRVRYVLERPVAGPAGTVWSYCGGATALLAALIERGAGLRVDEYAQARLFAPLGIARWEWVEGLGRGPDAASGLRRTARIGALVAERGRAEGVQVVPEAWVAATLTPQARLGELGYSNGWYLGPGWAAGLGNGGQRVMAHPGLGMSVSVMAGRYDDPEAWRLGARVAEAAFGPG